MVNKPNVKQAKHLEEKKEAAFLQQHCREVWWTSSRLPSGKQVSSSDKRDMVSVTDGKSDGFSVTKRLFASRHPAIQAVNEAFRKIDQLRDEYTIVKSAAATTSSERFQVEPGKRIIRVVDIEEFEQKFFDCQKELQDAVDQVAYCLDNEKLFDSKLVPSIKEMDQARLGRSFDPKDYPTSDSLKTSIKVTMPQYGVMKPDMLLPKNVLDRECERINQELGDTAALAASRVGADLVSSLETLARNLSSKVVLEPLPDGTAFVTDLIKRHPVEVVNVYETRHDRSIPADHVRLELSWKEVDANEQPRTVKTTTDVISKEYYEKQLRPRNTEGRRQLRSSSIDNLNQSLECLSRVQSMLGSSGEEIETQLAKVKELMVACSASRDSAQIAKELKTNSAVSGLLEKALMEAAISVNEVVETNFKARRKIVL